MVPKSRFSSSVMFLKKAPTEGVVLSGFRKASFIVEIFLLFPTFMVLREC